MSIFISSLGSFFTEAYGILYDDEMVENIFQTNSAEATAFISPDLIIHTLITAVIPAAIIWTLTISKETHAKNALAWIGSLTFGIALFAVCLSFGRPSLVNVPRGKINEAVFALQPSALYYSLGKFAKERAILAGQTIQPVGLDAKKDALFEKKKPIVVFAIIGETARAENHELNGYGRPTNPRLRNESLIYFPDATSCATSTLTSIRCMFSSFRGDEMTIGNFYSHENLIDVLGHANISTEWYDNDWTYSGAGAADRINVSKLYDTTDHDACSDGECNDAIFFDIVEKILKTTQEDKFVVLHLVGSHTPYYRRYPKEFSNFNPSCNTAILTDCTLEEIWNAYDNSIAYTDYVLSEIIQKVSSQDTVAAAIYYTSDHGESLGENGTFLHSAPLATAPPEQLKVPMFLWLSPAYESIIGMNKGCLLDKTRQKVSHDNFFHTMLGLFGVETSVRAADLDLTDGCLSSPQGLRPD